MRNQKPQAKPNRLKPLLLLLLLVFAGEIIFSLPFHITRFFRPTYLEVFKLSNTALGDFFALYGLTAMLSYFPGGLLADYFSARKLMATALLATAAGGILLWTIPSVVILNFLFAYWGVTTILLFWAAMLKTTRELGGDQHQGKAFGLLDGGRGLVAATTASIAVLLFSFSVPEGSSGNDVSSIASLRDVIAFYSLLTAIAGVLVYWLMPDFQHRTEKNHRPAWSFNLRLSVTPLIWLQGLVVLCAYCGYKGIDNYGLYVVDVLGFSNVSAAGFAAGLAYLRPIAAILAGFLADRLLPSRVIIVSFIVLIASFALLSVGSEVSIPASLLIANLAISAAAVFAIRGIYFSLIHQSGQSRAATGTAVGLVSVLGFTPDIFFAPIAGRLLDAGPGVLGHQYYFSFLFLVSLAGAMGSTFLHRKMSTNRHEQ